MKQSTRLICGQNRQRGEMRYALRGQERRPGRESRCRRPQNTSLSRPWFFAHELRPRLSGLCSQTPRLVILSTPVPSITYRPPLRLSTSPYSRSHRHPCYLIPLPGTVSRSLGTVCVVSVSFVFPATSERSKFIFCSRCSDIDQVESTRTTHPSHTVHHPV